MKRKPVIRVSALAIIILLGLASVSAALAANGPHGGYTATTDACASCHRIHTSPNSQLRVSIQEGDAFCNTCHNGFDAPAVSTHGNADYSDRVEEVFEVQCMQCHDAHGSSNLYSARENVQVNPLSGVFASVTFTSTTGINSYDDGSNTGICVVCHINVDNPGYPTSYHPGGANHMGGNDYTGQDCTDCHSHDLDGTPATQDGFMTSCLGCHGQPPDGNTYPNRDGSHSTHFTSIYGPQINPGVCTDCHNFSAATHNDGQVTFSDDLPLSTTAACNNCHSPDGTYDGVNNGNFGAKANWYSGVYSGGTLPPEKEKWCASCHDENPANSRSDASGIPAPNVVGDEGEAYTYGIGWGFYKTGHGLPLGENYPSSGDSVPGAGLQCDACHELSSNHIDHDARTYTQPGTEAGYQAGYRLKSVGGEAPLSVPRDNLCPAEPGYSDQVPVDTDHFRLCFSCHDSEPFTNPNSTTTNFRNISTLVNAHYDHLAVFKDCGPGPMWASDWSDVLDSRGTCMSCHNVHGSTRLSMITDGKLIEKEPGLKVAYYNPSVSYQCGGPGAHDPTPDNVTLPDSTGTVWDANVGHMCAGCHGSCGFNVLYLRDPVTNPAPSILQVFGRVGSNTLSVRFSEGVYSNPGASGNLSATDLTYTDLDDGRTIDNVQHSAGDSFAQVRLSSVLDVTNDIGVDSLSAATNDSIYDDAGKAMDTTSVIMEEDSIPPALSNENPSNGTTGVAVDTELNFTISDGQSGLDWSSFSITLVGNQDYAQTYTYTATEVSRVGTTAAYTITVNPSTDFSNGESITVTVGIDDLVGNPLVPVTWSFTVETGTGPQTIILHPSGLASNPGGYWTVPTSDQWVTYLDSNNGDDTYVTSDTGSQGAIFYMYIDDPSGLETATIQSITFHVYARYVSGWSPDPPPYAGVVDIGYLTGASTMWIGDTPTDASGIYNLVSSPTYTTDSDGDPLDITDINNLQIATRRRTSGGYPLRVTEIYVEVVYIP